MQVQCKSSPYDKLPHNLLKHLLCIQLEAYSDDELATIFGTYLNIRGAAIGTLDAKALSTVVTATVSALQLCAGLLRPIPDHLERQFPLGSGVCSHEFRLPASTAPHLLPEPLNRLALGVASSSCRQLPT